MAAGLLLKLVPFFLRTWTLLRVSRGNSDSPSAYLRPPHPPALLRPFQVWKRSGTRRSALQTPTWAELREPGSLEGPEAGDQSRSCPALPPWVPRGRPRGGGGWAREGTRQRGAARGRPSSAPARASFAWASGACTCSLCPQSLAPRRGRVGVGWPGRRRLLLGVGWGAGERRRGTRLGEGPIGAH